MNYRSRVSMDRQSQERSTEESNSRRESLLTTSSVTSERRTSYQSVRPATSGPEEPPSNVTSTATMNVGSKSFLQDRTPVRGMQDIIGRMRAGDVGRFLNIEFLVRPSVLLSVRRRDKAERPQPIIITVMIMTVVVDTGLLRHFSRVRS